MLLHPRRAQLLPTQQPAMACMRLRLRLPASPSSILLLQPYPRVSICSFPVCVCKYTCYVSRCWSVGRSIDRDRSSSPRIHRAHIYDKGIMIVLCIYSEQKKKQYLRVYGILRIPAMALQCPYRGVPVEISEADELLNRSLLLRRVDCRHFVLALYARSQVLVGWSKVRGEQKPRVAGGSSKLGGESRREADGAIVREVQSTLSECRSWLRALFSQNRREQSLCWRQLGRDVTHRPTRQHL